MNDINNNKNDVSSILSFTSSPNKSIRLKKDLIIPKGTELFSAPYKITLIGDNHYETTIGLSTDSSGAFRYCVDDMDNFDEWFEGIK